MSLDVGAGLTLAAMVTVAIATGATLDQAIKQLPARHRIGPTAYLAYVRAADMTNGLLWYPVLGIGTALITLAAVASGLLHGSGQTGTVPLLIAAVGTLAHVGITSRAAPTLLALRRGAPDEALVRATLDRFARLNVARATAMIVTLGAITWAVAVERVG